MTNLYEIRAEFVATAARLDELDLPPEVVKDTLEGVEMEFDDKVISVASYIKNVDALVDAIAQDIRRQKARVEALEARSKGLKQYLLDNMVAMGKTKVECALFKVAYQNNPASVIIDGEVPAQFMRLPEPPPPPAPEPDKAAIKAALTAGQEVPGAHLNVTKRLTIK
jgi:hypothetical protein